MSEKQKFYDFIVLSADGVIAGTHYASDARTAAHNHVKANPGMTVRIYRAEERVFSYVAVDDDAPKAVKP